MMRLKLSSKGELVIPKKIREQLGLSRDSNVIVEVKDKILNLKKSSDDIIKRFEERANRWNIDPKKLVYGDQLYEEIFNERLR